MEKRKCILIPLPKYGFDPTEVAIPWKLLTKNNFKIVFATPRGEQGVGDKLMVTGKKLGIWKYLLKARKDAVSAYHEMIENDAFKNPIAYADIKEKEFDGLVLPGGHDKGVKEYLESKILQNLVVDFFTKMKPVGAICHGLILAARSINPSTDKSVIYDYKVTSLLESQELTAYNLTKLWLKDYYLTYPNKTVESEVKSVLIKESNFIKGKLPLFRDSQNNLNKGFFIEDRNFVSARWPGDTYNFSNAFIKMMLREQSL
ncbi:MAG: protease I [Maribacter sp.]|jgi:protease I